MGVPADMTTALAPIPRGQGRSFWCAGLCRAGRHRAWHGAPSAFRAPCGHFLAPASGEPLVFHGHG